MALTVIGSNTEAAQPAPAPRTQPERPLEDDAGADFTFDDLIDIINPLHHIPIVSTIYRAVTGDEISVHARAIGVGLYGGPLGLITAGATMAAEEAAGVSPSGLLADLFSGDEPEEQFAAVPPSQAAASEALAPAAALAAPAAAQPAPAAAETPSLPFTARGGTRFFALSDSARGSLPFARPGAQGGQPLALATAPAPAPAAAPAAAPGPQTLSVDQSALLERFVGGASGGAGHQAPPAGATAEWFAARMQANLQKYAEIQAAADARPPAETR